jgi:hypothetical protein
LPHTPNNRSLPEELAMNEAAPATAPPPTYATLRPRFKQRQAETNNVFQNWQIRVHRSLSWLKRSEELAEDQPDVKFMLLWISLNSLYSHWDGERSAPAQESSARGHFVKRICEWDSKLIGQSLHGHRGLVKKLLENAYLSNVFWRDPENAKAKGWATQDANYLDRNLKARDYDKLLDQVLERLYVLRGQLMHGAATGGGKLNRQTLKYSLWLLQLLVPLVIQIVMEHGANDDWRDLCYPPVPR